MRALIALLCLTGLTLAACNKKAEGESAPASNPASQTVANAAAVTAPDEEEDDDATILDDGADDNDGIDMTCDDADDMPDDAPANRDAAWATPIQGVASLPNFHRVSDHLFRGAQPTSHDGFRHLQDMGIKTVVNLRSAHSDRRMIRGTGLAYESIGMKAWHAEDEDIVRFLRIVTDPARQPVFVHCQHGADRTGTMCAIYRIIVQGWDKEDAIREMRHGGFGFHEIWTGLPKYIRNLDAQAIRDRAGLTETAVTSDK
jgi:protein tyrosine phosphatase (PTP) superfamily phosphohydrolase (DUF442 family)